MTEKRVVWNTRRLGIQAVIGIALLALFVGAALYLRSDRFNAYVRNKVVDQLEMITGGRVELKSFHWNLSRLVLELEDLTIHGLEAPDELPYAHVDRLALRLKIISLMQRDFGFHYVEIQRPVFHLITYPDGTTNQPTPKVKRETAGTKNPVEYLFDITVERAEVRDGLFLMNNRAVPFDFGANDLETAMTFHQEEGRYAATANVAKLDVKFKDLRPLSATVSLDANLFVKKAEIKSLKVSTGRSSIEAKGWLEDFNNPQINAEYTANLNVPELGGVLRMTSLRGGNVQVRGKGSFRTGESFGSDGQLAISNFDYVTPSLRLTNANATASYALSPDTVAVRDLVAHAMGGRVTGEANVANWTGEKQQGTANFRLAGLTLDAVAGLMANDSVDRMNLAGTASGDVRARWTGSPANAIADLDLRVAPPAQPRPEQLPVDARIRGTINAARGALELSEMRLATRGTSVVASGALGARNSVLRINATSNDLGEFRPVLAAMKAGPLPIDMRGQASFDGTVGGTLKSPSIAGRVQVTDFETVMTAAAKKSGEAPKTTRMHWNLFAADVQYSPSLAAARNGVLRSGTAQVNFDGSANLRRGKFTDSTPFTAAVAVRNSQVTDLQRLAGVQYPVTGVVNLRANVSGTKLNPQGRGRLEVTGITAYGEQIRYVTTDILFANNEAQLSNIDVARGDTHLRGFAAYNLKTSEYRFNVNGGELQLASVQQLQAKIPATGVLTFTASGQGTKDLPALNASIRLRNLVVNNERVGDLVADAVTSGDTMQVTARSNFESSDLRLDGTVQLRAPYPANLTLNMAQLNVDPLLQGFLKGRVTGRSVIAGRVDVRGPLQTPRALDVVGNFDQFTMEVEKIRVRNEGPIQFSLSNYVATLRQFRIVGDETNFSASGTAHLDGARQLNLAADGQVSLKLAQSFNPDMLAHGLVTIHARVGGTMNDPAVNGTVQIANAGVSLIDLPNGLANINGTLVFNENTMRIQKLTGASGGGGITMGGFVTYGKNFAFNVTAKAKDIRLRYPPGVSAMADADLRLTGNLKSSLLSGDVVVTRFGLNPRFDFALYVARSKQPPSTPDPKSPLNNLKLDINVTTAPALQVQTSLAKVSGDADLNVRGTALRPAVLGRVNIVEGDLFFNGTRYHIERGDVLFANPTTIEPIVDMELSAEIRNYDISLGLHGSLTKGLNTSYRSDPPLASADIIQLLAFGTTREEGAIAQREQTSFTETASNAILSQALNAAVSSRVQKLFGVTRLKIDPRVGGAGNNPSSARVTVEQQVSNNFTLTYITDLARSNQQIIQVEYNVNRNVSIVAIRDENGVVGLDVRVRQRKR